MFYYKISHVKKHENIIFNFDTFFLQFHSCRAPVIMHRSMTMTMKMCFN